MDENEENSLSALREMLTEILLGERNIIAEGNIEPCRKERKKMRISGVRILILTPEAWYTVAWSPGWALFGQDRIFRRQGMVLRLLGMPLRE